MTAKLLKGQKLHDDNILSHRVQFIQAYGNLLFTSLIFQLMKQPLGPALNIKPSKRKKSSFDHLSRMHDDSMHSPRRVRLTSNYGKRDTELLVTWAKSFAGKLELDMYKKNQSHTTRQHISVITSMIRELRMTKHMMTDAQVQSKVGNWKWLIKTRMARRIQSGPTRKELH